MERRWIGALAAAGAVLMAGFLPTSGNAAGDFTSVFDGKSLKGWHVSAQTGHSRASGHKSGGRWVVENAAIVGSQDIPGNGGIVLTDKQYGDFEVSLEMNNDYGPDSGLFLRSNEKGQCYQAMIDYHNDGNLMGVYGEGIGGFLSRNFVLLQTPDKIRLTNESAYPAPFTPEEWAKLWQHGKWNELRARIEGNPPRIQTWIKGRKVMDWTDTQKRLPDTGGIALQIHGGGDLTKQFVRYRKVRVKELGR
ncbi:MAG: 3-keto-disaccharide hydrolase [Actinomycetota bacterium]